jgi:triosephosphate isomerase (TIM)
MRVPFIAGNWKMYKTRDEALEFIFDVNRRLPNTSVVETAIFAQAPHLRSLVKRQGDFLRIGAQTMHYEDEGAYTGEISPSVIQSLGCKYVLLGHSERREFSNETNESVNLKIQAAFRHSLKPIVCVGESLATRDANQTESFVGNQVTKALEGLSSAQVKELVIAYEPIWAIGTGVTCEPEMANQTIAQIRALIASLYDANVADSVRMLYGGSVKPSNVKAIMAQSDIDGALVGGASLDAKSFLSLVHFNDNV